MNIKLTKFVDRMLGRAVVWLVLVPPKPSIYIDIHKILIIRPGGIGDAVLLTPSINYLKLLYPDIRITILAERRNAGVFTLIPAVDQLYCYDKPAEFWQAVTKKYDVVIDTEQWHRLSAVVARLVRAPVKIGFSTNERSRMFNHEVSYSHDDYEAVSFARLIEPLGAVSVSDPPFLVVPDAARQRASESLGALLQQKYVVLFPGASIAERRWGADKFRQVAQQLADAGFLPVVVGGVVDQEDARDIVAGSGISLAGKTSLAETAAVISMSSLVISGDSGVLHIAVGLDVSTVSLFGPGRSLKWAPRGEKHIVLNKQLPCSPCTTYGTTPCCSYGVRCMQEIDIDMVVDAAFKLLQTTGAP